MNALNNSFLILKEYIPDNNHPIVNKSFRLSNKVESSFSSWASNEVLASAVLLDLFQLSNPETKSKILIDSNKYCSSKTASILESLSNDYESSFYYRYLIKLSNAKNEAYVIKLASEIDRLETLDIFNFNIKSFMSVIQRGLDIYELGCVKGLIAESNLLLNRVLKSQELIPLLKI